MGRTSGRIRIVPVAASGAGEEQGRDAQDEQKDQ
jgi:hypothetical protein